MCTLIVLWRAVDGYDIVLGMNREEIFTRPADPPALLEGEPPVVAPRDRKAGGTWLGASGNGLVVGLSNRRGRTSPTARSRGLLALEALRQPALPAVDLFLRREVQAHEYNFWNMLVMNRKELRFFRFDGDIGMARGHEGLNVLTNEGGNVDEDPKVRTVRALLDHASSRTIEDARRTLESVLRHHADASTSDLCFHRTEGGTVSSTILALNNATPEENLLLYANGAPCQTPYRDFGDVIRHLPSPD